MFVLTMSTKFFVQLNSKKEQTLLVSMMLNETCCGIRHTFVKLIYSEKATKFWDPCNENRFFPLGNTTQGKPCSHYRDGFAVYQQKL